MRESKGQLEARLRLEGRWEAYKQLREKYKAEGSEGKSARLLAAEQFPPLAGPLPSPDGKTLAIVTALRQNSARKCGPWVPAGLEQARQAVVWVADQLDKPDARQADAPCPAAGALLRWVRRSPENEDEFWKRIYARLLPVPGEVVRKARAAEPSAEPVLDSPA
ncbi:MAG: hypothetical protein JNM56_29070 [Planctomycetia bacterium]|nr:hypothetical protein [Planctomycetia bacterium]